MVNKISQFVRNDGYNPSSKCDDPIVKSYIHKQVVKKLGDTEDDFILDEKPVLIDEYNIQKRIDEEAKTTDLKYLLSVILNREGVVTGDEPELNVRQGSFGDITGVQSAIENGQFISPDQLKAKLPQELQDLSIEDLCNMSDEEIVKYISSVRESKEKPDEVSTSSVEPKVEESAGE